MQNTINNPQESIEILTFWKDLNKLLGDEIPQNLINKLSGYTLSGTTSIDTIDKLQNIYNNLDGLERVIKEYNLILPEKIKLKGGIKGFFMELFSNETRDKIAQILEEKENKRIAKEEDRKKQEQLQKKKRRFVSKFTISFGEFNTDNTIKFWAELLKINSLGIQKINSSYNEEKDIVEIKVEYYHHYKVYTLDYNGNIRLIKENEKIISASGL